MPPLVVIVQGGPTSQARAGRSAQTLFFTTRGYAVLLVNHRGSTGYGRKYMLKQRGRWGLVDVEDCVSGAKYLAEQGKIDGQRTVIMGGSAGGYTVLQTMVDAPEAFTAGICLYGIANQFTLVADTHKFEERYSDKLLGSLPEAAELYRQRSPLFHAGKIKRPLAIFQGDKDKVVPKDQSDVMVKALQRNGTPCVYHVYEGEGHGFRKAETIEHFYKAIDSFLKENVIYR
jgi:dipeptidyl aminopeptidase/acylaminoacyl peptidase